MQIINILFVKNKNIVIFQKIICLPLLVISLIVYIFLHLIFFIYLFHTVVIGWVEAWVEVMGACT